MGTTTGATTGWHRGEEWRLNGFEAERFAHLLEETGRVWASAVPLAQGCALVELRSRYRPYPLLDGSLAHSGKFVR
jgi:hypothetical protein